MPVQKRRPPRSTLALRWLAVGAVVLVAFLYYRPVRTYLATRNALAERRAEVRTLQGEQRALERRLAATTSTAALAREARRLGFVKPGEHLYIVKGIVAWSRAQRARVRRHG